MAATEKRTTHVVSWISPSMLTVLDMKARAPKFKMAAKWKVNAVEVSKLIVASKVTMETPLKMWVKRRHFTVIAYVVYPRKNQACILMKGSKPDLGNVATVSCHRLCSGPPSTERRSDQSIAPSLTFCHWGTYKKHGPPVHGPSLWTKSTD